MKNIITAAILISTLCNTSLHTVELRSGTNTKTSTWYIQKVAQQKKQNQKSKLNDKNKIKELSTKISQLQKEVHDKNTHITELQKCISSMVTGM